MSELQFEDIELLPNFDLPPEEYEDAYAFVLDSFFDLPRPNIEDIPF